MPSAVARTGVPMGAEMSMPGWNSPSPLPVMGSSRWPKLEVIGPRTGQRSGAETSRLPAVVGVSVPKPEMPSTGRVAAPRRAELRSS